MSRGEREDLEREDEAHCGVLEERPGPCSVRKHDVRLQLFELLHRDARLRQSPKAGVDAISRFAGPYDALDRVVAGTQRGQARGLELERGRFARDPAQRCEVERLMA